MSINETGRSDHICNAADRLRRQLIAGVMHIVRLGGFCFLFGLLVLTGCTPYLAPGSETEATVYVLNTIPGRSRDAHALLVNENEVALLQSRQYTWFQLAPGNYSFAVSGGRVEGSTQTALKLLLKPGSTRYLVYDEEERYNYLIEYAEDHAHKWLKAARFVSNSVED